MRMRCERELTVCTNFCSRNSTNVAFVPNFRGIFGKSELRGHISPNHARAQAVVGQTDRLPRGDQRISKWGRIDVTYRYLNSLTEKVCIGRKDMLPWQMKSLTRWRAHAVTRCELANHENEWKLTEKIIDASDEVLISQHKREKDTKDILSSSSQFKQLLTPFLTMKISIAILVLATLGSTDAAAFFDKRSFGVPRG